MTNTRLTNQTRDLANPKVIIVSQRLPVRLKAGKLIPSDGGLVSAITGSGVADGSLWVGSLGPEAGENQMATLQEFGNYLNVPMDADLYDGFYNGFCNQVLWPAFHDRIDLVNYQQTDWLDYRRANRRFAEAIVENTPSDTPVWVHDYHLMLLPQMIKELQPERKVVFFLHIPWPSLQIADRVPHLCQAAKSLLSSDGIVFHTDNYKSLFRDFVEEVEIWLTQKHYMHRRDPQLFSIPVGIAAENFQSSKFATQPQKMSKDPIRIVGVDRFDYSKGIDFKLLAFNDFLETNPDFHGKVSLHQLLVPTRETIPAYKEYQSEILSLAKFINQRYGTVDWMPVDLTVGQMTRDELVDFYHSGDVCFVSSSKDGMNLVSMEYLASQTDENPGVLLISEQAGAAHYLSEALKFRINSLEDAVKQLRAACEMRVIEKRERWQKDLQWIKANGSKQWALRNMELLGVDVEPNVDTMISNVTLN